MKTADPRLSEWEAELEALLAEDPFAVYEQKQAAVIATSAAYRDAAAELEARGIPATTKNPASGLAIIAAPLRPLRAAMDSALAERRTVEAVCLRVDVLRRSIEAGGSFVFEHKSPRPATAAEAVRNGGRALVWNPETRRHEWQRSTRAPKPAQAPPKASEFAPELERRRAVGRRKRGED